jgi:phage tail protein X
MKPKPVLVAIALCLLGAVLPARAAGAGESGKPPRWYRIRENDTLAKIARRFYGNTDAWQDIKRANPGLDERRLEVGQRIFLPAPGAGGRPPAQPKPEQPPGSENPAPAESGPPGLEREDAVALAAYLVYLALSVPAAFFYEAFLLWLTVKLIRRRLVIREPTMWRALRGTFLTYLLGTVVSAALFGIFTLSAPLLEKSVAFMVLFVIFGGLAAIGWIWGTCAVLGRNYGLSTREGLLLWWAWHVSAALLVMLLFLVGGIIVAIVLGIVALFT